MKVVAAFVLTALALAAIAPAAQASDPFDPSLAVSASTYAAGQHPALTITVEKEPDGFHPNDDPPSFWDGQDLQDMRITLPLGLAVNPRGIPYCGLQSGEGGDWCSNPDAQVGTGEVRVEVWVDLYGLKVPVCLPNALSATIYNEAPLAAEQARTVVIVQGVTVTTVKVCGLEPEVEIPELSIPGFSMSSGATLDPATLAPVLAADDLPRTAEYTYEGQTYESDLSISRISLTLDGSKGSESGYPFISNPTSCEQHSVIGSFTSYGDDKVPSDDDRTVTDTADYPVTDCDALAYNPQLEYALDSTTPLAKPSVRQVVTQQRGEAATGSVTFSMPAAFGMNPDRPTVICTDDQIAARSCPAGSQVATVTVQTPLLAEPLTGGAYMGPAVGDKVRVVTLLNGPVSLTMEGTLWQRPDGGLDTVTQDMPDLPIERMEYVTPSGDAATFRNPATCGPQTVTATFTSRGGRSLVASRQVDIQGCVAASSLPWRRLHASILPRKPSRPARLRLMLAQDPGAELRWIDLKVGGGLRWKLAGHPRRRALGAVEIVPEEGVPKEYDLYPVRSGEKRLDLKTRTRKHPVTVRIRRAGGAVRMKMTGLSGQSVYDVAVRLFGKREKLLRTPRRCHRSAAVTATVGDGAASPTKVVTELSPGCGK